MGYRFKSDSEQICLVKMVDTIVLKFVPMGYWFDSEYLMSKLENKRASIT